MLVHTYMCTHMQDPMNLGAILRCAFYLGVDRVIVTAKNWLALMYTFLMCWPKPLCPTLAMQLPTHPNCQQGKLWSHGADECTLCQRHGEVPDSKQLEELLWLSPLPGTCYVPLPCCLHPSPPSFLL